MRKDKIVMFGILFIALSMSVATVYGADVYDLETPWTWMGVEWTQSAAGAYTLDLDSPDGVTDFLVMQNIDTEGTNYASKITYRTENTQAQPWVQFDFQTPYSDIAWPIVGGVYEVVDPWVDTSAEVEFFFSSEDGDEMVIHLDRNTLSYLATKSNGVDYDGSMATPSNIWKPIGGTNTVQIGVRSQAEGGDIDIWFNNVHLFTFADTDFVYDGSSILNWDAHILCRSEVFALNLKYSGFEALGSGYTYTSHDPSIDSISSSSVSELETFELSGVFSDANPLEIWGAEIDWGEGSPETFDDISIGAFEFEHDYPNSGVYSGTITITDNEGGTTGAVDFTATITDVDPVIVSFNYDTVVAGSDNTITVAVNIITGPDSIASTTWTEGIDVLSSAEDPTIVFTDLNSHDITLTVVDSDGSSASSTWTISPTTPSVILGSHADADLGDELTFTGTFDHDGYGISGVEFDYGDGTVTAGIFSGTDFSGTHTYSTPDTYTVEVTVTSSSEQTATDSIAITIDAIPPVVTFKEASINIDEGDSQTFDLDFVDLTIYSGSPTYTWTVTPPGTTYDGESFSSEFLDDGTYEIKLKVQENGESDTHTMDLIVANIAPHVTLGANIYEIPLGTLVDFTSTVYDDGEDIDSITFEVEGDATVYDPDTVNYESTPYHEIAFFDYTFTALGSFQVTSTATDDTTSVSNSITVTVVGVPLEMESIVANPKNIKETDSVTFTSRVSGTDIGQTYTVEWYLNDALVETITGVSVGDTIPHTRVFPQDTPFELELKISGTSLTQTYVGFADNSPPIVVIDNVARLSTPGSKTMHGHITDAADHPFKYKWKVRGVQIGPEGTLESGEDLSFNYEFSSSGSYLVELFVTDNDPSGTYTGVGSENVKVNYKPVIDSVEYSPDPAYQWSPVAFTVEASDRDGDSLDYYWVFGDGETSTNQNPTHTYTEYGDMSASVRVTDSLGVSRSETITVDVRPLSVNIAPIISDTDPIYEGDFATFTSSFSAEDYEQDYTVEWKLNGVVKSTLNNVAIGATIEFTHEFTQDGSYLLELVVVEAEETKEYDIEVNNIAPVVVLDPMGPLLYLGEVEFTATIDDVEADHPFTYTLTLDSGEVYTGSVNSGFIVTVPHTFTVGGEFEVELKVLDSFGERGEDLITVIVNNPPIINSVTYTPELVTQGDTVEFTIDAYDPDEGEITYLWSFGDGETTTEQNPSHTYTGYGVHAVTVSVTDEDEAVVTYSISLNVDPEIAPPHGLKLEAIEMLEDAIDEYGDKGKAKGLSKKDKDYVKSSKDIKKSLEKIIDEIEKSLDDKGWNDDLHLDVKDGHHVFNHEGHAESKADTYARKWDDDPELDGLSEILYKVIDLLVEADRSLAKVVFDEANQVEILPGSNYEHYLVQAEEHYLKGKEHQESGDSKKAIDEFKKSWQHSIKILDKFPHPHWEVDGWDWTGDWDEWYDWDWDDDNDSDDSPNGVYTEAELEQFSKKELEKLAKELGVKLKKRDKEEAIIKAILDSYDDN
jgi:PKD repeat protein